MALLRALPMPPSPAARQKVGAGKVSIRRGAEQDYGWTIWGLRLEIRFGVESVEFEVWAGVDSRYEDDSG